MAPDAPPDFLCQAWEGQALRCSRDWLGRSMRTPQPQGSSNFYRRSKPSAQGHDPEDPIRVGRDQNPRREQGRGASCSNWEVLGDSEITGVCTSLPGLRV